MVKKCNPAIKFVARCTAQKGLKHAQEKKKEGVREVELIHSLIIL